MSSLRHLPAHLKESSSAKKSNLTIEVALLGNTFKASGEVQNVTKLFEQFLQLLSSTSATRIQNPETETLDRNPMTPVLQKIFEHDNQSPILVFRNPPTHDEPLPNWVLLLLLGYRELRNTRDVTATVVIHALRHSSHRVPRLDRLLQPYLKEKYLLKGGRGRGGFYRLTSLGAEKAYEKAKALAVLL